MTVAISLVLSCGSVFAWTSFSFMTSFSAPTAFSISWCQAFNKHLHLVITGGQHSQGGVIWFSPVLPELERFVGLVCGKGDPPRGGKGENCGPEELRTGRRNGFPGSDKLSQQLCLHIIYQIPKYKQVLLFSVPLLPSMSPKLEYLKTQRGNQ